MYPPRSLVGAWITTHEHLRHLAAQGHEVHVVPYLGRDAYDHEGVQVHKRHALPNADVVIAHLGDDGSGKAHARRLGVPLVYMVHGQIKHPGKLADCQLAVFNSHHLRGRHAGVVAHPPLRREDYATTPGTAITQVNLNAAKGGHLFWALAEALPDLQFLGVRGGYGGHIRGTARNVTVQPTTTDMRSVYARTRVLLMPSEHESWGRVALEAACSGIPTIAHPTPGLVEALGPAGIFVDRNDQPAWERELRRLEDPDEWAIASCLAFERAGRFDPDESLWTVQDAVEALL